MKIWEWRKKVMFNVGLMNFKEFGIPLGRLTAIEGGRDIPFEIKRVYYITDVPCESRRGFHSHRKLHQILLCLNGSVTIQVNNGVEKQDICLSSPHIGLYIGPNVWREMYNFTTNAVLMVLASDFYDESDYIRDFDEYLQSVNGLFNTK